MTKGSNKFCPKTQSDNAAKSTEQNGVAKTQSCIKTKPDTDFRRSVQNLEKSVYKQKRLFI